LVVLVGVVVEVENVAEAGAVADVKMLNFTNKD
jgi:hypothetical protein